MGHPAFSGHPGLAMNAPQSYAQPYGTPYYPPMYPPMPAQHHQYFPPGLGQPQPWNYYPMGHSMAPIQYPVAPVAARPYEANEADAQHAPAVENMRAPGGPCRSAAVQRTQARTFPNKLIGEKGKSYYYSLDKILN